MRLDRRAWFACVLGGALALVPGCPEPTHNEAGPSFAPGVAERNLALLDRFRRDAGSDANAPTARAHARRFADRDPAEALSGPGATARPGDFVLENDEALFVIGDVASSFGLAETGGHLIDAVDARGRFDALGVVFACAGGSSRQAMYERMASGEAIDGSAWVEATGRLGADAKLAVMTRYALAGPDRALLITTKITNTSERASEKLTLGDFVQWGAAEATAPGKALGFRGASAGPYIGGIASATSYAITSDEGKIAGDTDDWGTRTAQATDVVLAPGTSFELARVFVVGVRGDVASIVAELMHATGQGLGAVEAVLVDENGQRAAVPVDARVGLFDARGQELLSMRASGADVIGGEAPPGKYEIAYVSGGGRAQRGAKVPIEIVEGKTTRAKLDVTSSGSLAVECTEAPGGKAMPCKATIEGAGGTRDPDLGPAHAARGKNRIAMPSGTASIDLAPGRYRVTLSRGPEYAIVQRDVVIEAAKTATVSGALAAVVDTKDWLAVDFDQHTFEGGDSPVSARERLIASAAEGVEIAVTTKTKSAVDFGALARELKLEAAVVPIALDALAGVAPSQPWGSEAVVVWRGRDVNARTGALSDFFARLLKSQPATAIAGSGSRSIVGQELGYPRTMVRVAAGEDQHLEAWDAARSAELRRGIESRREVFVTNGPFLRVTANGASIGGIAKAGADHMVEIKVHVETAPWVLVDEVVIMRASASVSATSSDAKDVVSVKRGEARKPTKSGGVAIDTVFRLRFDADDAFVVVARGVAPMSPVLSGDARTIAPWAMTGAIWVDADGDGKSLARGAR